MEINITKIEDFTAEGHWSVACESQQFDVIELVEGIEGVTSVALFREDGMAVGDNTTTGTWMAELSPSFSRADIYDAVNAWQIRRAHEKTKPLSAVITDNR